MQIRSARPIANSARQLQALSDSTAPAALRDSTPPAAATAASPRAARAAYSRATRRLANRLQGPLPEDVAAQPRSVFRRVLERIRNTLLGAS